MSECHHELCEDHVEIRPIGDDDEGYEVFAYWCLKHRQFTDGDTSEATASVLEERQHQSQISAWLENGGYGFNDG